MARHSHGLPPSASLILACALWAIATVISKDLLASVPPITFFVIQLIPSTLVLWVLVLVNGVQREHLTGLLPLALLGWLNPGLSYTLSMLGLTRTTASVATLLWAAEPTLIVAMAWFVLREAITIRLLVLIATAACGVLLVTGIADKGQSLTDSGYGVVLILGGVLCCALYTVLSRRIASRIDPLFTVAIQQTVGLVWALAIWQLEHGAGINGVLALSQRDLVGGAISGLMYYAAAFWFYLKALRSVPASTAGVFLNLTPVFGVAIAHAFLGERLTELQWIGAATILFSVLSLTMWSDRPRQISTE